MSVYHRTLLGLRRQSAGSLLRSWDATAASLDDGLTCFSLVRCSSEYCGERQWCVPVSSFFRGCQEESAVRIVKLELRLDRQSVSSMTACLFDDAREVDVESAYSRLSSVASVCQVERCSIASSTVVEQHPSVEKRDFIGTKFMPCHGVAVDNVVRNCRFDCGQFVFNGDLSSTGGFIQKVSLFWRVRGDCDLHLFVGVAGGCSIVDGEVSVYH